MIEIGPRFAQRMTYDEAILNLFMFVHNGKKDWRMPTEYEYYYGAAYLTEKSWHREKVDEFTNWYLTPVRDVKFVYIPGITCYNKDILFNKRYR
jgi:hypothetical protein